MSEPDLMLSAQVQTTSPAGYQVLKLAVMTVFDNDNDVNLISPKLVTEVLGVPIQPWEATINTSHINGGTETVQGFVDLYWGPERSNNFNWTRFMVTKHPDPPFDMILGRKDASDRSIV